MLLLGVSCCSSSRQILRLPRSSSCCWWGCHASLLTHNSLGRHSHLHRTLGGVPGRQGAASCTRPCPAQLLLQKAMRVSRLPPAHPSTRSVPPASCSLCWQYHGGQPGAAAAAAACRRCLQLVLRQLQTAARPAQCRVQQRWRRAAAVEAAGQQAVLPGLAGGGCSLTVAGPGRPIACRAAR